MSTTYVTVAIPYVNAEPHLGYGYELVQADIYARARRLAGDDVRFLGGTDDHALKNVLAAEAAGVPTDIFVDANAQRFASDGFVGAALSGALSVATGREVSIAALGKDGTTSRYFVGTQATVVKAKSLVSQGKSWGDVLGTLQKGAS